MNSNSIAVEFKNVSVNIGGNNILSEISAYIPEGESTAIVGPNGAGKTTLLLALLGQISYGGEIQFSNKYKNSRPRIGYVPQRLNFDRGLPLTVIEFMVMGMQKKPLWFGVKKSCREEAMIHLLSVNAENLENNQIGSLSGGELQRVLLALALHQDPQLVVLDEPAAGVDIQGEMVFCEILEDQRRKKGFTQLMVSHDLGTVTHHADHVICLNRKLVAEGNPQEVLTSENLTALFGIHMGLVDAKAMPNGKTSCNARCCKDKNA